MSVGILKGKVFNRTTAYFGIIGGTLLLIYLVLVTFVQDSQDIAMIISAPGGILSLIWMSQFTIKLFKLRTQEN
jgi:TM2 domain-containing membrane protein YozV